RRYLGREAMWPLVNPGVAPAVKDAYVAGADELRASGIAAEVYLGASGMKAQMKYADRRLSPAAVILGGDEIAAGTVTIKDLDLGRALASDVTDNAAWRAERPGQQTVPRDQLVGVVRRILGDAP
ncbi:MAG: His/Gly/Thr/Pro-type tRNA ligase C-terminal domain-containing protein, partial [Phenylobacterium sp.]